MIRWSRRHMPASDWRAGWEARDAESGRCIAIVYLDGELNLLSSGRLIRCGSHAIAAALVERGER